MTKEEFATWQAITESSRNKWVEDDFFRLNGHGEFYHIGGEEGQYIKIHKDGRLEVGEYEGAFPHIGEAMFTVFATKHCKDYNEAFEIALTNVGGKKFLVDLFSQEDKNEIVRAALAKLNSSPGKENAEEKGGKDSEGYTSVRKAIKENSAQPKPASKGWDAVSKEKAKGGGEL